MRPLPEKDGDPVVEPSKEEGGLVHEVEIIDEAEQKRRDKLAQGQMYKIAGSYGYIGIEFGVGLLFGYYAGRWIDGHFETAPTFMYLLMFLGLMVGVVDLYRLVKKTDLDNLDDPT